MVGIIIKAVIGFVLFAGSLVGGLAATGRLNHEGTANIPVLNSFFPEPEKAEEGEGGDATSEGTQAGTDAAAPGGETKAADGMSAVGDSLHKTSGPQEAVGRKQATRTKQGPSVDNPEPPPSDSHGGGHGGGGHGGDDSHADDSSAHDTPTADAPPHGADEHEQGPKKKGTKAERDFDKMKRVLESQGKVNYQPGAFFTFDGMPAGLTPTQINEAWKRVQSLKEKIEQRNTALDLRDAELQELAKDIGRRQKELSERSLAIEGMQAQLDAKIAKFEKTVKLVRNEEIPKLKRNAASMAAFERSKAAELVQQQWATERGQDEVLRLFEVMDKDAVNEILATLPNAMVQDVLEKRMQVSREAAAPARKK
jgi:hypothetical protein